MTFVYVYRVENLVNYKQYVGITVNYHRRCNEHKSGHGSRILYAAFKKYGIENFKFEVIDVLPDNEAKELEILLIKCLDTKVNNGYNIADGGEGTIGVFPSKETRRKMSESLTGRSHSEETRHKMSESHTGKSHSEGTRRKMSESRTGKQSGMLGKSHSEETKEKIRVKATGRRMSESYRRPLLNNKGSRNPSARRVLVNGNEYGCMKDAAISEDIKRWTLQRQFSKYAKTNKWPLGWSYLS